MPQEAYPLIGAVSFAIALGLYSGYEHVTRSPDVVRDVRAGVLATAPYPGAASARSCYPCIPQFTSPRLRATPDYLRPVPHTTPGWFHSDSDRLAGQEGERE